MSRFVQDHRFLPAAVAAVWSIAGFASLAVANSPAPPACDDATFLRRASLDLVGRQPPPAEVD